MRASDLKSELTAAVLTGDIVESSALAPEVRDSVHAALRDASAELRRRFPEAMPLDIDIFRGDSWQCLLLEPHRALHAALVIRSRLIAAAPPADTRIAVAIGAVDRMPDVRASEGDGESFRLSGRLLDGMARMPRLRFACADARRQPAWDAMFQLVDALIVNQWTPPRARAVSGALSGLTQQQITELWPQTIQQASVSEFLSKAGWNVVQSALAAFESAWQPLP